MRVCLSPATRRKVPTIPISFVLSLVLSLAGASAAPRAPAAATTPVVDTTGMEVVEDLSESLANALLEFSVATRRRDLNAMGRFLGQDLLVESFPYVPGALTHELKWIEHHAWDEQPSVSASAPPAAISRGEFLSRLGAFLDHFSEIEDVRFKVKEARFDDKPASTGEARVYFYVVGRDAEGRREWARGTCFITAVGGGKEPWRITRWRTASLASDVATTDIFSEISRPAGIARTIPAFGVPPNDGFISHGGAAADLNEDGLIDMVFTEIEGIRLFINDGKGAFRDASKETLLDLVPSATAALPLDYDNDGDLDLFLSNVGRQHLLENRLRPTGTMTFQDVSEEAGVAESAIGFSAVAADVNGDGLPDIYVTAYNRYGTIMPNSWSHATNGTPNLLFVNQGNGRFREMAHAWGVDDGRWSLAAAFADLDGDSRLDLFVANDFGEDALFMNMGGRFEDQAAARGVQDPGNGMGVSFGDHDNDGDLDLHVTNMSSSAGTRILGRLAPGALTDELVLKKLVSGNTLYENLGDGHFRDVSEKAGKFSAGWAWGGGFIDFDNDGWEDEFTVNGFVSGNTMNDT